MCVRRFSFLSAKIPGSAALAPGSADRAGGVALQSQGQPTIHEGVRSPDVRSVQRALRRTAGADLVVDGVFGPRTKAAVEEFQQAPALKSDGVVGAQTWNELPDGRPMPVLPEGSTGQVVEDLQRGLTQGAPGR